MSVVERALEKAVVRATLIIENGLGLGERQADQDELRAAYRAVIHAEVFDDAYPAFEAKYGAEAFTQQGLLAIRRVRQGGQV